ncbi:MAG: hypothetical protein WBM17_07600 [Anaerolineales bacterium]
MEKIKIDGPKAPIGFFPSVWKAIEYVNGHPGVLVIPVLVDAFLWFGPRLSISALLAPIIDSMTKAALTNPANAPMIDALKLAAEKFNLFSLLAFIPLIPPSLMSGALPDQTPFGNPIVLPVSNWMAVILLAAGLVALSLLIGSAYLVWTGGATQTARWPLKDALGRWARTVLVMGLLCAAFFMIILVVALPILFLVSLVALAAPGVGAVLSQLVFFLGGGFFFWVILFFMFSMHGTVLHRDGVMVAVWNSINTSRWMYPVSIWIPMLLVLLNFLTSSIWSLAPFNSWAGAVGVLGNAYTGSVVVVASMAYYIDKRRWIDEVRTYLQTRMAGKTPPGAV